ncbi:hypothetical protein BGX23_003657 [Mortierella sp. AD031]|nr:hypothetical protein BGX23_003657 [Mortierella sp. AD031]
MMLVMMVLLLLAITQTAIGVMNYPPSHIDRCPDAYLFEFTSEPGTASAAEEVEAFKAKMGGMDSVSLRKEFGSLINGSVVSPPGQVQPRQNVLVTSALNMTGVTRVHTELGLTGQGVKVGVIDTGIDYNHPALGGCFGPGCRVAYGYDFVGDAYDGKNKPKPSSNPMDCAGHGSHVAGIIGASDDIVTGVAPKVILGAYRVLGCSGSSNDDVIIAALERAAADKMDVINLSIGGPNGWPVNPVSRAIEKLQSKGIMVTVSQGNENTQGLFSTNYVAVGSGALSVASFINTRLLLSYFTIPQLPDHNFLYRRSDKPGLDKPLPMVALMNGTELGIGCDPYKEDLKGKVVLVSRGVCLFYIKAVNAIASGAAGILFANNAAGSFEADIGNATISHGTLSQKEGQNLFNALKSITPLAAGGGVTGTTVATFSARPTAFVNPAGGTMSVFSSYGLDNELHIKPNIGAPGENIYSTWPVKNGSYTTLSGTSMASPHVAGALALAIERLRGLTGDPKGPLTPTEIQRIYATFMNTAKPAYVFRNHTLYDIQADTANPILGMNETENSGVPPPVDQLEQGRAFVESVAKQGSGMVNIYRALTSLGYKLKPGLLDGENAEGIGASSAPPIALTHVYPPTLELNDTSAAGLDPRGGQTRYITISNYGPRELQYELSHISSEGLYELSIENRATKLRNVDLYNVTSPTDKSTDDVMFGEARTQVEFSTPRISIPGDGGQRRVAVTIVPPSGIPKDQHWIYSGYIVVRTIPDDYSSAAAVALSGMDVDVGTKADSNPADDNSTVPPPLSDAIHVSYAGVVGSMRTMPILLRPTDREMEVNNQTVLCQTLSKGAANKTKTDDFVYSFKDNDTPILTFCLQNPSKLVIMDLISAAPDNVDPSLEADNNNNDPEGTVDRGDYKVLGRIATSERHGRSLREAILSQVEWDGTLDLGEGNGVNTTRDFKVVPGEQSFRGGPGRDLIYGMRPKTEDDGSSSLQSDRTFNTGSSHESRMLQRREEEVGGEVSVVGGKGDGKGKGKGKGKGNGKGKTGGGAPGGESRDSDEDGDPKALSKNAHPFRKKKGNKGLTQAVPNGRYRLRIRGLRMLGDPNKAEDYDYWITRTFTIRRLENATIPPEQPSVASP